MIRYPISLASGPGALVVPEELTAKEAKRVAAFVAALTYEEQPALPTETKPHE